MRRDDPASLDAHATDLLIRTGSGVDHNLALLEQSRALVEVLTKGAYTRSLVGDHANTIGGHLRHLLDHQQALLDGIPGQCVDYASRRRGTPCEVDPVAAARRIDVLMEAFATAQLDETLTLDVLREDRSLARSSLARELDFAAAHATHHLALVSVLARVLDIEVPKDLGVAASTLRYRCSA